MKKRLLYGIIYLGLAHITLAQTSRLDVKMIMQDPKTWIGASPSNPFWAEDGQTLYFYWNPQGKFPADSLFKVPASGGNPVQVSPLERRTKRAFFSGWHKLTKAYSSKFDMKVYEEAGDLYVWYSKEAQVRRLTRTLATESNPQFSQDDQFIFFNREGNVYRLALATGATEQLTDLRSGDKPADPKFSAQDQFLRDQQAALFTYIRAQTAQNEARKQAKKRDEAAENLPRPFYFGKKRVSSLRISPTGRFASFNLITDGSPKNTIVQNYVAEDGYATDLRARPKVGVIGDTYEFHVMDLKQDTVIVLDFSKLPHANTVPEYLKAQGITKLEKEHKRLFVPHGLFWNAAGTAAFVEVRTYDNKDRWLVLVNPETGELKTLDHQHDEAWIGGPGISWFGSQGDVGWLPDGKHIFFQSEKTGFSHLYTVQVETGLVKALTEGSFEVFSPQLSKDGSQWFFTSSEGSPFERHFYSMPVQGGVRTRLTTQTGKNEATLHPDEQTLALLFSYSNQPPEVYLHTKDRPMQRLTTSTTAQWKAYAWRDPEIVMIPASDGAKVPARLYTPKKSNGAAVLFVHGAGYLQNVHRWWSQYFREYMFHNLLADLGYTVLDVDYRASEGYGRDWRTAIYRHMGGRDLQDFVDASKYVQQKYKIPAERVGIYGGSYGGFITLMALFTEPKQFGAGAALRSVTDWAHYNHGYTANILNTPATDSLAIARSSPIYFAEGLEDPLLICHGVVDTNVHFQDVVRLSQRLIELGKENWEMAIYPIENHGFTEPSSWTDEYRRILKLFEENIGANRRKK